MAIQSKYVLRETDDGDNRFYQTLQESRIAQKKYGGKIFQHIRKQIFREVN